MRISRVFFPPTFMRILFGSLKQENQYYLCSKICALKNPSLLDGDRSEGTMISTERLVQICINLGMC